MAVGSREKDLVTGAGLLPGFEILGRLPRDQMLGRIGYAVKRSIFALPFYPVSLSGPGPTRLNFSLTDAWPGNAELGGAIIAGRYAFAGQVLENPKPLWRPRATGSGQPRRSTSTLMP